MATRAPRTVRRASAPPRAWPAVCLAASWRRRRARGRRAGRASTRSTRAWPGSSACWDQSLLEQLQRVDALERELRQLRGENEALANELETLTRRERELYADTDRRVTDDRGGDRERLDLRPRSIGRASTSRLIDGGVGVGGGAGPLDLTGGERRPGRPAWTASGGGSTADPRTRRAASRGGAGGVPGSSPAWTSATARARRQGLVRDTATAAEKTAYTQAYDLLARGQNEEAVARFDAFLREFPDGPYSDNAWYWQGEAMYAQRRFDEAVRNFRVVVDAFPNGPKVPDARLKIGYAFYEQGDYANARRLLTTVRDEYPGRSAAVLARKRLQQMDREGR